MSEIDQRMPGPRHPSYKKGHDVTDRITRRTFTKATAAAGATTAAVGWTAAQAGKVAGANERVRIGIIGVGNRGGQVLNAFLKSKDDVEFVAICDVYKPHLEKTAARLDGKVDQYGDFRKILDRQDIDAVVIATPDHWHAVQTIQACNAGKDVYVEKPLSVTVHEGRKMVEAARRNKRVVQVGTHRRSSELWHKAAVMVQAGDLGQVTVSRAFRLNNMYPNGIGKRPHTAAPGDLDWDMWLGPRPSRPYQDNITPYKFRWWQVYSSQMGNWGVHYLDAIRWCIDQQSPSSICAMGGRYAVEDDRTIPDTAEAMFEFTSGHLALFGTFEATGNPALREGELELRGTKGTAYVSSKKIHVVPERGGQFQDSAPRMEEIEHYAEQNNREMTAAHARNFLDCVKSRELPNADVETGHRSTTMSLLANISLAMRQRLEWDAKNERFTNPVEANDLLHYEYRKPWTLD